LTNNSPKSIYSRENGYNVDVWVDDTPCSIPSTTEFTKYIENHPETWAGRNDKAWLQFRIGDIDGALATLEPANDYNPWTQNTYGTMLLNKGRLVEAKKAFLAAEYAANNTSQTQWGKAYPGNDPRIYPLGLEAMKKIISENIALVNKKLAKK
jgi:tetratricopeptide (TPR) repeat protein